MENWQLEQRQAMPLDIKILYSGRRIREWYEKQESNVYVSFSGGKDSTVLLSLVRSLYPDVPAVFCDTGLEYPEVRDFVKQTENVIWLKPKMDFQAVIEKYGYPVVSKEVAQKIHQCHGNSEKLREKRLHGDSNGNGKLPKKWQFLIDAPFKISSDCCDVMKKRPFHKYEKQTGRKPFVGTMAADSRLRMMTYLKNGCNAFDTTRPISSPLGFWREADIWEYLRTKSVKYSTIYDMGYERTGCMFCAFGVHLEKQPGRFERMAQTHPAQHQFCMEKLGLGKVLQFLEKH